MKKVRSLLAKGGEAQSKTTSKLGSVMDMYKSLGKKAEVSALGATQRAPHDFWKMRPFNKYRFDHVVQKSLLEASNAEAAFASDKSRNNLTGQCFSTGAIETSQGGELTEN